MHGKSSWYTRLLPLRPYKATIKTPPSRWSPPPCQDCARRKHGRALATIQADENGLPWLASWSRRSWPGVERPQSKERGANGSQDISTVSRLTNRQGRERDCARRVRSTPSARLRRRKSARPSARGPSRPTPRQSFERPRDRRIWKHTRDSKSSASYSGHW
jgi:hypothetical protein